MLKDPAQQHRAKATYGVTAPRYQSGINWCSNCHPTSCNFVFSFHGLLATRTLFTHVCGMFCADKREHCTDHDVITFPSAQLPPCPTCGICPGLAANPAKPQCDKLSSLCLRSLCHICPQPLDEPTF